MSTALDYLNAPEFADDRLTETINVPRYNTGRPAQLGIFTDRPIPTTYVRVAQSDEELSVIPSKERGGESNLNMRSNVRRINFDIPHFPLDDAITPADLQNVVGFGDAYAFVRVGEVYNDKLTDMRGKHDLTHSHLDWGALSGLVLDGEGKQLYDLYDEFGFSQTVINMELDTVDTDILSKNTLAKSYIRKELRGTPATGGIIVLAGAEFFDKYAGHKNWRDAVKNVGPGIAAQTTGNVVDEVNSLGWRMERVDEEYPFRLPNGTFVNREAVASDEAILIPLGTPFFKRYHAPADSIVEANRAPDLSQKVFVSTDNLPHGKGQEIHTESNVLPICLRPQLIVKLTVGA